MIPDRVIDFHATNAVGEVLSELQPLLRGAAASFTHDRSFIDDLMQEAAIELWQMDPTRFDGADMEYVCGALYKHMHNVARAERAARGGKKRVDIGAL